MRKLFTLSIILLLTVNLFGQAPQKISYQAVIRNANDQLVTGQQVGLRISIIHNSIDGNVVYQEIYNPNPETNNNGLLSIEIGQGVPLSGVFVEIDWSAGPYFIKTETDPSGGTNYTISGTSQLLSVPYALHAKTVENISETQTLADVLVLGNNGNALQIKNIADPTEDQDASTKKYVDSLFTELLIRIEELEQICGISTVTFIYNGNLVTYGTVVGANNRCWLDRNLGASRVANSSSDQEAYGDLYQWGRGTDGHQIRTSGTTSTLSNSDTPEHGNFILAPNGPYDWRSPQNTNLWQGVNGTNNPCPTGYRIPTEAELNTERTSWSSNNAAGAFASPLKLPVAGRRSGSNGSLGSVGSIGRYWSSTVDGTHSRNLYFSSSDASMYSYNRAFGYSVRCLKD